MTERTTQQPNKERFQNAIPPQTLVHLENLAKNCDSPGSFKTYLFNLLDRQEDPLSYALDFVCHALTLCRHPSYRKSFWLVSRIFKLMVEWCKRSDVSRWLTQELKDRALNVIVECSNTNNAQDLCQIFELKTERENAKKVVNQLLSNKNFKKAYYLISALDLESEYDLKQCVFPLFFLEMEVFTKQYLTKAPHYQIPFVTALDELSHNSSRLREFERSISSEGLYCNKTLTLEKYVMKKVVSYAEFFNVDTKYCPNLYHMKKCKAMHYLFRKKFAEDSIEYDPWEEMMVDLIGDDTHLQKELLVKLVSANEARIAVKIAEVFNLPPQAWPDALKYASQHLTKYQSNDHLYLSSATSDKYLQLRLSRSDVHFIDTPKGLQEAVEDISENYNIVGMDVEWKPDMGLNFNEATGKSDLLQLAVWDAVYLVDMFTLKQLKDPSVWDSLLKSILCNKEIIKLGFGSSSDLKFLTNTIKGDKEDPKILRFVDFQTFFTKLRSSFPSVCEEIDSWHPLSSSDLPEHKGLSQLCRVVLGKYLSKSDQFSNWERRPLRESQVNYAALDAFCLLMIYEKVYPLLKERKLDLEAVMTAKPSPKKEKPKKKRDPMRISDFKVVVDNSVRGLTKYLRVLGANVACLDDKQNIMDAIKIAQNEHRIVLSGPRQCKKVLGYLPEEMCFAVNCDSLPRSQVVQILEHFNVICENSSLLSRCTVCNANEYINVHCEQLSELWNRHVGTIDISRKSSQVFVCDVLASDGIEHRNVPVQLASFSGRAFEHVREFYVCVGCGKVYWLGSHLSRLKTFLSQYVDIRDSNL